MGAPLAGPFPRLLGVAEQVAVRTPLLVNVFAAAHQLFLGPEQHRIAVHRPTSLKPELVSIVRPSGLGESARPLASSTPKMPRMSEAHQVQKPRPSSSFSCLSLVRLNPP